MAESLRKESLIAELASARDRLGGHSLAIRRKLSPAEQIKRGVRHHPAALIGGAILLGLLLSRIPARRKQVKIDVPARHNKRKDNSQVQSAGRAAAVVTILKFGLDLAKPALTRWLRERLVQYATAKRSASAPSQISPAGLSPRDSFAIARDVAMASAP